MLLDVKLGGSNEDLEWPSDVEDLRIGRAEKHDRLRPDPRTARPRCWSHGSDASGGA